MLDEAGSPRWRATRPYFCFGSSWRDAGAPRILYKPSWAPLRLLKRGALSLCDVLPFWGYDFCQVLGVSKGLMYQREVY